jgi:phenylacetate-CoA ligase
MFKKGIKIMFVRQLFYLTKLLKQQWLEPEKLEKLQEIRLRKLVCYTYKYVPFYHNFFRLNRIKPKDIKTINDLKKLPIIRKEEIRKNLKSFVSTKLKKYAIRKTSGTTGPPLTIFCDKRFEDYWISLYARALLNVGYKPWEKIAYISSESPTTKFYNYFGFMRKCFLSRDLPEMEQLRKIKEEKAKVIISSVSDAMRLSSKIMETDFSLNPKFIVVGAEKLTGKSRKKIENAFNTTVYEWYGATEFMYIAWECKEHSLHINEDCIIEFLKGNEDVSSGERGRIIITCLENYAMPLIRYEIGDTAIPVYERCKCGRNLPIMKHIRREDNL